MSLAVVIMAAGKGTRMKSDLAKVLHPLNARPMIHYVLETAFSLNPQKVVLIIGHQSDAVKEATRSFQIEYAVQSPQLGTGHAVMQTEFALSGFSGEIVVLSGDAPLVKTETLLNLLHTHRQKNAAATVLTAIFENPLGYGRVIRGERGDVLKIVEQKDASLSEQTVQEINSGIYVFNKQKLFSALKQITNQNAQQEYYLPDVFKIFFHEGDRIAAVSVIDHKEISGVNTPEQLKEVEAILRQLN